MNTHNTFDNPDAIKPVSFDDVSREGDELVVKLKFQAQKCGNGFIGKALR